MFEIKKTLGFDQALYELLELEKDTSDDIEEIKINYLKNKLYRSEWNLKTFLTEEDLKKIIETGDLEFFKDIYLEYISYLSFAGDAAEALRIHETYKINLPKGENPKFYFNYLTSLGIAHHQTGNFNESLNFYKEALEIVLSIPDVAENDPLMLGPANHNISEVYYDLSRYNEAIHPGKEAIKYAKLAKNELYLSFYLYFFAVIKLRSGEREDVPDIISEIAKIYQNDTSQMSIQFVSKLTQALFYKSSSRLDEKMLAQPLFRELVALDHKDHQLISPVLKNYVELLLIEIKSLGNVEALSEAHEAVSKLISLGKKNNKHVHTIDGLILKAKLNLINGNIRPAEMLLNEALEITTTRKMDSLQLLVQQEIEEFKNQLNNWKELVNRNASIYEKLDQSNILDYIELVKKDYNL